MFPHGASPRNYIYTQTARKETTVQLENNLYENKEEMFGRKTSLTAESMLHVDHQKDSIHKSLKNKQKVKITFKFVVT